MSPRAKTHNRFVTLRVPDDLYERAKRAGEAHNMSMADVAREGLVRISDELETLTAHQTGRSA